MKSIDKFISEQSLINNGINDQNVYFSTDDKHAEYVIVYPYGLVEAFTKNGLEQYVKDMEDELIEARKKFPNEMSLGEAEENIWTYKELLDIPADGKWHGISGPANSNSKLLDSTIGFHYKRK